MCAACFTWTHQQRLKGAVAELLWQTLAQRLLRPATEVAVTHSACTAHTVQSQQDDGSTARHA